MDSTEFEKLLTSYFPGHVFVPFISFYVFGTAVTAQCFVSAHVLKRISLIYLISYLILYI